MSMRAEPQYADTPFTGDAGLPGEVWQWDSPDGQQLVELPAAMIRELRAAAIDAFCAIPRRGVEIGGLLL
jgi:hypothetical protein